MFNPKQPLWLPQGSVRAILALVLVTAVVALAFLGLITADRLVELAAVVVAFYFAGKQTQQPPSP